MQHQGEQAERLGLLWEQRRDEATEPDPLLGEVAAARVGARRIRPAFGEGRVERIEHRRQARRELGALGHLERDAGLPDLPLGAHQALAHRGGRHQERRADAGGVEAEQGLEDQRRADARVDGGMRAGEHQGQAFIREPALRSGGGDLLGHLLEMAGGVQGGALPSRCVDPASPRHGEQPGLGIAGNAPLRPVHQRDREGVGQSVLRPRDVARARRQQRHELAVALPRDDLGGGAGGLLHDSRPRGGAQRSTRTSKPP
jgi:hypothetical protein